MRELLMELYLLHGEREFSWKYSGHTPHTSLGSLLEKNYITIKGQNNYEETQRIQFQLTRKALEFLKNDS